jgi:hypothetical protein
MEMTEEELTIDWNTNASEREVPKAHLFPLSAQRVRETIRNPKQGEKEQEIL